MKNKLLVFALLVICGSVMACWLDFIGKMDANAIRILNRTTVCTPGVERASWVFNNGESLPLPITVYVTAGSMKYDDGTRTQRLTELRIQYRVFNTYNGRWRTNKWIDAGVILPASPYVISIPQPSSIFGNYSINTADISSGDHIYIRYYVTDGTMQSGNPDDTMDSLYGILYNYSTGSSFRSYGTSGDWSSPFVIMCVYNGTRRLM